MERGEGPQQGGLSDAVRAEQTGEFAAENRCVDMRCDGASVVLRLIAYREVAQQDGCLFLLTHSNRFFFS